MREKGLLLITVCMMAAGVLAGCGAGSQNVADTTQETQLTTEAATATEAVAETDGADASAEGGKTLVVYYSGTGNTERVAEVIAEATGGELFELEPVDPYTDEDLNYNDDNSRVSAEYANPEQQEVALAASTVEDWSSVEKVYVGYPIWWSRAAWPVNEFIKSNDFTGKTVIPFCTSASSGLGRSGELLAEMAGTGNWQEGIRFSSGVSDEDVIAWVESLDQ